MADDVIALAATGRLRGTQDGPAFRFLGIPYAAAPGVAGRFAAPVRHPRWEGVRDALTYGASSPQPDRGITLIPEPIIAGDNELNLNVFTPDLGAARLPVLVWVHGGGYFGGCNASPWYEGRSFARDGIVLVSINYRLGALGFLELPDAPANRAVLDWVLALQWVQDNIDSFGGDPGRVTIGGQSAGGGACATLLGVPAADGLFRSAICMSGGPELQQTADGVRAVASELAQYLGVPLRAEALDSVTTDAILAGQEAVTMPGSRTEPDPASVVKALAGVRLPWAPWVDGEVVTEDPWQAVSSAARNVQLLIGATAHEFNMGWRLQHWITEDLVRSGLASAGLAPPQLDAYLGQFRGRPPCEIVGQAVTDRTFRVPAQNLAAASAVAGGTAFVYDFRWQSQAPALQGQALHCLDIPFAFDGLGEAGVSDIAGEAPPESLAAEMHEAWVRFVADGSPGWEPYNAERRAVMIFDERSELRDDPLRLGREAWSSAMSPRRR